MAERPSRPPSGSNRKHSQVELGGLLAHLRVAKGLSLRQVEEATDKAVSNAYLSQLEKGRIQKPSPHVGRIPAALRGRRPAPQEVGRLRDR
jgi:hypothetical protein